MNCIIPDKMDGCPPRLDPEDIEIGEHSDLYGMCARKKKDGLYGFTRPKKITHVLYCHEKTLTCHSGGASYPCPYKWWYLYKEPIEIPEPEPLTTEETLLKVGGILTVLTDRIKMLEEKFD